MRSSISAQSCDSVPPAPGWMVTIALLRSCSPPSIFLISAASTFAASSSSPRELGVDVLARRPIRRSTRGRRSRACSDRDQREVFLEAAAALQHLLRFGLVVPEIGRRCAGLESGELVAGRAASKIPPEIGGALHEVLVAAHQIVKSDSHGSSVLDVPGRRRACSRGRTGSATSVSASARCTRTRRRFCHRSCGPSRKRTSPTSAACSKISDCCDHAAVRIDDAADAGVGRARQVAALLDRAHRRQLESADTAPTTGRTRRRW